MYTVTFYSYKGGVGRTMALMNVGLALAQSGYRVLLVDFDLEAPSLQTFNLGMPHKHSLGIVDYITHYLATDGLAPDVEEYLYASPDTSEWGDRLWIMPAGKQDGRYGQRFSAIDWQRLYAERNGYLLFEDLKAQWKKQIAPDYVLIDSRTGHNEEGGICTRQLPDAVTILFFPNEQNLSGLTKVVSDIRNEAKGLRKKEIQLHFVNSNVPDLDDDNDILATRMQKFQKALGFEASTSLVIHHYHSLALLNQEIFTRTRPRSRLAQQYHKLVEAITHANLADRKGALAFLKTVLEPTARISQTTSVSTLGDRLNVITRAHSDDGEIAYHLANIQYQRGRLEEALAYINNAIASGYEGARSLLRRAELYRLQGNTDGVVADVRKVLDSSQASPFEANLAVRMLRDLKPSELSRLPEARILTTLDFEGRFAVAYELFWHHDELLVAKEILTGLVESREARPEQHEKARSELACCLIGLGHFHAAMELLSPLSPIRLDPTEQSIATTFHSAMAERAETHVLPSDLFESIATRFNYAMAEWAETHVLPEPLLQHVVDLDRENPSTDESPNYMQCLAIAHWAVGDTREARERISLARQKIRDRQRPEFSVWRYLNVSVGQFESDLDALGEMVHGKNVTPQFMEKRSLRDSKGDQA